jgi:NADPH-dependent 2,4-dienoyl-CoA reductase/sulfur reductase-like enzyme/rhodanese-related sulfurtransferase
MWTPRALESAQSANLNTITRRPSLAFRNNPKHSTGPSMVTTASHQPPRILIVGAVAGGASAAARARRMNERAEIILFERDPYISFANCGLPYHIGGEIEDREKLLIATPRLLYDRFRIETRVRHEVVAIDRSTKRIRVADLETGKSYEEEYDKLILSPGAAPILPDVPGVDAHGVFTLRNIPDMDRIIAAMDAAKAAVVVGAGYIGLEMAEQFARKGLEVSIVELRDQVMPFFDYEIAEPLHREIERHGVRLELGRAVSAVETEEGVATGVALGDGTRIPADIVLFCIGVRPLTGLAEAAGLRIGASGGIATDNFMRTSDPDIYAVGDAAEYLFGPNGMRQRVPLAGIANKAGRVAGQHAATGSSRPCPSAWSTSIVRVFEGAAGLAGLSQRDARREGYDAGAVHIVSFHHASYYPGASPLAVKLVYDRATRRVLGAQVIGLAGVDKRLDVITTLIHFRGTVDDLAGLDLAYAPPFGSAKDPLHMAAFAAQNDLDGLAPLMDPGNDLSPFQVVDVRSDAEVAERPFPAAEHIRHIPLDQLRDRLGELERDKPTVVACRTGLRSYVAVRILLQHGFPEVYNLSGSVSVRDFAMNRKSGVGAETPAQLPNPQHMLDFPD